MTRQEQLTAALRDLEETLTHHSLGGFFHFAKERDLTPSQLGILIRLGREGMRGIMRIGGDMKMTGAGASQMIDRLVQAGFVARCETPDDRRARQITLTPLGERTVKECMESRGLWLAEVAARIGDDEALPLLGALKTLSEKLKEQETAGLEDACAAHKENRER